MVIPLGDMGIPQGGQEAPEVVKTFHSKIWRALIFFFFVTTVGRFIALDIFGGLIVVMMAFYAYFLLKDDCANMTQCNLLCFGCICLMNFTFDLIPLGAAAAGRKTNQQSTATTHSDNKETFTITVETHDFFDHSMSWHYNLQSVMMIVAPVAMLAGAILVYFSYNAYPTSLFRAGDDDSEAAQPFGGAVGGTYSQRSPGGGDRAIGRLSASPTALFEGQGQRLGS